MRPRKLIGIFYCPGDKSSIQLSHSNNWMNVCIHPTCINTHTSIPRRGFYVSSVCLHRYRICPCTTIHYYRQLGAASPGRANMPTIYIVLPRAAMYMRSYTFPLPMNHCSFAMGFLHPTHMWMCQMLCPS